MLSRGRWFLLPRFIASLLARHGSGTPEAGSRFRGNPYRFLGPRPFREQHLRSYVLAQHRSGRRLVEIAGDRYVRRLGSDHFFWTVVQDARTLEGVRQDIRAAISDCNPNLR
jgi:hypothetical protein